MILVSTSTLPSLSSSSPMAAFSSFCFHPPTTSRFFLPLSRPPTTPLFSVTPKSSLLSLSSHFAKPTTTVRCQLSGDVDDSSEPQEQLDPPVPPEEYASMGFFDDGPPETEEEVALAYEELYGPAYSGESYLGNDIYVMDAQVKSTTDWSSSKPVEKVKDGFEERVIQVRRVTKVVKGGKQLNFRAVVVVGNKQAQVGVGVGKAREVITAVQKAALDARRNIIPVPMTKYLTFPHRADGKFGAATVMLRPACPGSGVIAGGVVRVVLELAGVENALGKQLGSKNILNNARATVVAMQQMRQLRDVAAERGIPMEELFGSASAA